MANKNALKLIASLLVGYAGNVMAADFQCQTLLQAQHPSFLLSDYANKSPYHDFFHQQLGPAMLKAATTAHIPSAQNQTDLIAGKGISVKLSDRDYDIHLNFPKQKTGGRSYGWTEGLVGDWTDKMYLDNLQTVIEGKDTGALKDFYTVVISMLAASDASKISDLKGMSERVATNFLAIYSAEEYRSIVPQPAINWDDAILQVTLLGAFHGGQSTLTKFYLGDFKSTSKTQKPGVFNFRDKQANVSKPDDKKAAMDDYWQDSAIATSVQSGINETRADFQEMGMAITQYEAGVAKNPTLTQIQAIVKGDKGNVISAIAQYFVRNPDIRDAQQLISLIPQFLMDVYKDADKITAWVKAGSAKPAANDNTADDQGSKSLSRSSGSK